MWEEIEVVPTRTNDRSTSPQALRELGLLVGAAILACLLVLLG